MDKRRTGSHLFQPGVSGNPGGKSKGAVNKRTLEYAKVRTLAAESYEKMFNVLLEKGLEGESWAQQLYYKEFIPKKAKEQTALLRDTNGTYADQVKALTEALLTFNQVTQGELMERLKVLTAVKFTDEVGNENNMRDTRDAVMNKMKLLEGLIDMKRNGATDKDGSC